MSYLSTFKSNTATRIAYQTAVGNDKNTGSAPEICRAEIVTASVPPQVVFKNIDDVDGSDLALSTDGAAVDVSLAAKAIFANTLYVDNIKSYTGAGGTTTSTMNINISGNAATATKLETARTISLTGAITGNVSFDGSGNVNIVTTSAHNHDDRYFTETESNTKFATKIVTDGNYISLQNGLNTDLTKLIVPYATTAGSAYFASSADYAEYYLIDENPGFGYVVCVNNGDDFEIEKCDEDCCKSVIGVISQEPGFTINAKDKDNPNAVAIAVVGKTPVMVKGVIYKGQPIVSTFDGAARAIMNDGELLYKIGTALETNTNEDDKLVLCSIK